MLQVVCVTPRPCSHKEKKSLSFIWASGQCPRTGGSLHTPTPAPVGQRARSGLPAACYERLWVSSSDYCLGGFTQSLHLSHPQMRLLFPLSLLLHHSIPVSSSITLSGMLPVSLIAGVWFSLPPLWFHLSGRFFFSCSKEKHKTHGGRCSPSHYCLSPSFYMLHSLVVWWLCNS